tara:strand:- start:7266 stop:8426 length:1161 start_codon:yes stop_codon:yes gene_type:complete
MSSSAIDIFGNQVDNFKNKIINGNFDFWQRMRGISSAWTFTLTGSSITSYVADRWFITANANGGDQYVLSAERKAFAAGQSKILSLPKYYMDFKGLVTSAGGTQTQAGLAQRIEDVKTLAGKQVTCSFWVKGTVDGFASFRVNQKFGSGGSPSTTVNVGQRQFAVATSWTQVIFTFTMPPIASGTSIGTNNDDCVEVAFQTYCAANYLGQEDRTNYTGTLSISQVQIEEGAQATLFDRRMPEVEQSMCQRYFETGYVYKTVNALFSGDASNRQNFYFIPYKTKKKPFEWAQDSDLKWDNLVNSGQNPQAGVPYSDNPSTASNHIVRHSLDGIDQIPQNSSNILAGTITEYQPEGFTVNWSPAGIGWSILRGVWMVDAELYLGETPR